MLTFMKILIFTFMSFLFTYIHVNIHIYMHVCVHIIVHTEGPWGADGAWHIDGHGYQHYTFSKVRTRDGIFFNP